MNVRLGWIRRRLLAVAVAALCVVAISGTALAGHQTSGVKSYTGCLVSGDGVLIKIKEGTVPRSACTGGQVEAHFSGGDITKISVGSGLSLPNGGDNGEVRIVLDASHSLPQGCDDGEVAKWETSLDPDRWVCRADDDTTYDDGTGLDLSASNVFSIEPAYRVKNTPDCSSGQFATGFDGDGDIQCAAPAAPAGSQGFFSRLAGDEEIAGTETVLSETLPAGNYLLFAHVVGTTPSFDDTASGGCDLGSDSANVSFSDDPLERDNANMTLLDGIVHAGGVVALTCTETEGNFDVASASFAAIKLDSIG
jgi:hypothetical protein